MIVDETNCPTSKQIKMNGKTDPPGRPIPCPRFNIRRAQATNKSWRVVPLDGEEIGMESLVHLLCLSGFHLWVDGLGSVGL